MRPFNHIDPIALKAFYFAALAQNFTRGAELAGMTQSGISQHIARLEEELGADLFLRAGRKVLLTPAGEKLKSFAETYLDQVDEFLGVVGRESQKPTGVVRYAMPASCLMTPHFPMLLQAREKFDGVDLHVNICHSEEVVELLLDGEIDFGFITRPTASKEITQTEFAREEYVMVSATESTSKLKAAELLENPFVVYPGMDLLFETWYRDSFSQKTPPKLRDMRLAGQVNDLSAAITMVTHGMGISVFPRHCVQAQIDKKKLSILESGKSSKGYPIFLVKMAGARSTLRVEKVIEAFWKMKRS